MRRVNAFAISDTPGGLSAALNLLEGHGVNIEYMYALVTKTVGKAYAVMRTNDEDKAEKLLNDNGIELLDEAHI